MTNFKVGQKVVCIKKGKWISVDNIPLLRKPPSYKEICVIAEISNGYLILGGYDAPDNGYIRRYHSIQFRPLVDYDIDATQEILSKFKPIECTHDVEIKVHKTAN
jgi:hypothetical protein